MTSTELATIPTWTQRWLPRFWIAFVIVESVLLAIALLEIARGTPDAYLNQHKRHAASALMGIGMGLSFLLRRPALVICAMTLAAASVVWSIALLN